MILIVIHLFLYPFDKYLCAPIMCPTVRIQRWAHLIAGFQELTSRGSVQSSNSGCAQRALRKLSVKNQLSEEVGQDIQRGTEVE